MTWLGAWLCSFLWERGWGVSKESGLKQLVKYMYVPYRVYQTWFSCSTAGNASYVIGTLAETDLGKKRIVHICTDKGDQAKKILPALTDMLDMVDTETVMNAAGTMGTLVGH